MTVTSLTHFDVVGKFELKKITPNYNALANYFQFVFSWQCVTMLFTKKQHAMTSLERAHNIK